MSDQNNGTGLSKYTPTQVFQNDSIVRRFEKILGENARGFVTSVLQVINDSDKLKKADPDSIYNAAMIAASLNLPINPNLGFAYIIPYNIKNKGQVAQFQMGYKGYIQLAQRTGMYKTISAAKIYEGQLVQENPLTGYQFDFDVKASDKAIGYAAYFKLINGFEKTSYMTLKEVEEHAIEYASTFYGIDNKKSYGNWSDNFDSMAKKTVLKLLLSKYGPLSVDMQTAIKVDQAEIKDVEGMEVNYIDNNRSEPEQPTEGRQQIDTQQVDEETPLYDEVMELGKKVHSGDWFKKSKVIADNISDGRASFINELNEDELKKAKKFLEMGVAEEEG